MRIEPKTPVITEYDSESDYMKTFWKRYSREVHEWDAKKCSICEKTCKLAVFTRRHFLSHFDSELYIKFDCSRCNRNYGKYESLTDHVGRGLCFLRNFRRKKYIGVGFFPKIRSKNESRRSAQNARGNSIALPNVFPTLHPVCTDCDSEYATYESLTLHFDYECNGTGNHHRHYNINATPPRAEDIEKEWTEELLKEEIRSSIIPQV